MAIDYRKVQQLRLSAIGRVTDTYTAQLKKVLDTLQKRMLVQLGQASQNVGSLGDAALARAQVQQLLVESGYYEVTGNLLSSGYQTILNNNLEIYRDFYSPNLQFSDVSAARLDAIRTMRSAVFDDLAERQATNLQQILLNLNFGTSSITSAAEALANDTDRSVGQAETIIRTSVHAFEREANVAMADAAGIEQFIYVGPDDKLTREFCQEHIGDVKTLEEWSAITAPDAYGPVPTFAGGPNCRHSIVPYTPD